MCFLQICATIHCSCALLDRESRPSRASSVPKPNPPPGWGKSCSSEDQGSSAIYQWGCDGVWEGLWCVSAAASTRIVLWVLEGQITEHHDCSVSTMESCSRHNMDPIRKRGADGDRGFRSSSHRRLPPARDRLESMFSFRNLEFHDLSNRCGSWML